MFVSKKLEIYSNVNISNISNVYEFNIYIKSHRYYMTDRFELCSLNNINKYLFNHFDGFYKIINHDIHITHVAKQTRPIFIIQRMNTDTGLWQNINDKRLRLHEILK